MLHLTVVLKDGAFTLGNAANVDGTSNGTIVVALIGDEATVKYYRPRSGRVELVPANEKYDPIQVTEGQDFRILGVVTGVLRTVGG